MLGVPEMMVFEELLMNMMTLLKKNARKRGIPVRINI